MSSSDLPKLWTTSSKIAKFVLSKSFFSIKNQWNLSDFFSVKNIRLEDQLSFGRSDDDMKKKLLIRVDCLVQYSSSNKKFRKIPLIFDAGKWFWKYKFCNLWGGCS